MQQGIKRSCEGAEASLQSRIWRRRIIEGKRLIMSAMIILLIALALLVIPPVLIIALPPRWLMVAAPTGALGMYSLIHLATDGDLGPAGIFIMVFFELVVSINIITLVVRFLKPGKTSR